MKEEAKMVYLLECLQKTPPPVSKYALAAPAVHLGAALQLCSTAVEMAVRMQLLGSALYWGW